MDCSGPIIMWVWQQNLAEKIFTDGFETAKTPVFSLESFSKYGIPTDLVYISFWNFFCRLSFLTLTEINLFFST